MACGGWIQRLRRDKQYISPYCSDASGSPQTCTSSLAGTNLRQGMCVNWRGQHLVHVTLAGWHPLLPSTSLWPPCSVSRQSDVAIPVDSPSLTDTPFPTLLSMCFQSTVYKGHKASIDPGKQVLTDANNSYSPQYKNQVLDVCVCVLKGKKNQAWMFLC